MNTYMSDHTDPGYCDNPSCGKELYYGDGVWLGAVRYCRDCAAELADLSLAEQVIRASPRASSCDNCIWPEICQLPIVCGYKNLEYIKRTDPDFFAKLEPLAKKLAGRLGG